MRILGGLFSLALLLVVLWDAFETVVLPRRVTRRFQLAAFLRRVAWALWSAPYRNRQAGLITGRSEDYLALFGPLFQLMLLGVWIAGLVVGFAGLLWAFGSTLGPPGRAASFGTDLYFSGTTFFTLGLGDVTPGSRGARAVAVIEAGTGFAFLALIISYLPILYQAFSRREVNISLLDARAGSPPTALAIIQRCSQANHCATAGQFLHDWEIWTAELLETHLSYPVLGYFRSQHENQSWVAALAAILDVAALGSAGLDGIPSRQAELTFAMARHAVVDLASVFNTPPVGPALGRLSAPQEIWLAAALAEAGAPLLPGAEAELKRLHRLYEPYIQALADHFLMPLPGWFPAERAVDNWQSTAWGPPGAMSRL
jgi:hypothetical protein